MKAASDPQLMAAEHLQDSGGQVAQRRVVFRKQQGFRPAPPRLGRVRGQRIVRKDQVNAAVFERGQEGIAALDARGCTRDARGAT